VLGDRGDARQPRHRGGWTAKPSRPPSGEEVPSQSHHQDAQLYGNDDSDRFFVLLATGLTRGELVGLRWADVDLDTGEITIAGLRHTHAALLFRAGVSPLVVSKRLGHSTFATTRDMYGHLIPSLRNANLEAFEKSIPELQP